MVMIALTKYMYSKRAIVRSCFNSALFTVSDFPLNFKTLIITQVCSIIYVKVNSLFHNIVAAFWRMHVSPAKYSYAWLPRKCDYRTDKHTDGQTDTAQSDPYVPLWFQGDTKNLNPQK